MITPTRLVTAALLVAALAVPSAARAQNFLEQLAPKYPNRMFWLTDEEIYKKDIGAEILAFAIF